MLTFIIVTPPTGKAFNRWNKGGKCQGSDSVPQWDLNPNPTQGSQPFQGGMFHFGLLRETHLGHEVQSKSWAQSTIFLKYECSGD